MVYNKGNKALFRIHLTAGASRYATFFFFLLCFGGGGKERS